MIRRFLQIIATALVAAMCSLPCPSQTYTTGTSYPLIVVGNGPGLQDDPHLSGHYAVYTDSQSPQSSVIKYFDFANQTTGIVPQGAGALDLRPDISGGTIVFMRMDMSVSAIYSHAIGGTPAEVAPVAPPAFALRQMPAIGGSTIAWEDVGVSADSNPELVVDSAGAVTQLTADAPADQNPSVSPDGATVVWEKCDVVGSCDAYAAVKAGSSWNVSQIAATAANEISPDTNGSLVVYASDANGSSHVHFRAVSGGPDQTITMPPGWVYENHPAIAGDFIAFEAADGVQTDIWIYDVAASALHRITNTAANEMLADVSTSTSGGTTTFTVAWQVAQNATNVYATQFQVGAPVFTGQYLPPLDQSTDPANPLINKGKNGRVIPVKVQISQGTTAITDQNSPGPVTIGVSKLASCASGITGDTIASYADAGQSSAGTNQYRFEAGSQVWIYNLDTRALALITGSCYRIDTAVNGTQISNAFVVLKPTM